MRSAARLAAATLLVAITSAFGAEDGTVLLNFEQACAYKDGAFQCAPSPSSAAIFRRGGKWFGIRDEITPDAVQLRVVKEDRNVVVLENPVRFSGASTLHLMKRSKTVYWSEVSFSEVLQTEGVHMKVGTFAGETE